MTLRFASLALAGLLLSAGALPAAAASCEDAKAHFDVAREIGTREALQVHVDAYGDCPFAPLARMLMEKLPAGSETSQAPAATDGSSDAAPPAVTQGTGETTTPADDAGETFFQTDPAAAARPDARKVADAFRDRLIGLRARFGTQDALDTIGYETAEVVGSDVRITGFGVLGPSGGLQTRLRFAETLLVKPVLGADGTLAAESVEMKDGRTEERRGEASWEPALNPDGFQILIGRIAVTAPRFHAPGDRASDALGRLVGFSAFDVDDFRFTAKGADFFTLAGLSLGVSDVVDGLPGGLTLKVDSASIVTAALAAFTGARQADFDAFGYTSYTLGLDTALAADRAARTLSLDKFSLTMTGGFGASITGRLVDVDLGLIAAGLEDGSLADGAVLSAVGLEGLDAAYADAGLVAHLFDMAAKRSGMSASALKSLIPAQVKALAAEITDDPALAGRLEAAATTFLADPKVVALVFNPSPPLTLSELEAINTDEAALAALARAQPTLAVNRGAPIDIKLSVPGVKPVTGDPQAGAEQAAECDRLAADSDDPMRTAGVAGVKSPRSIDADAAIPACEAAHAARPGDRQITFQLGRSYYSAGRFEDAVRSYGEASDAGQPIATYELAQAYYYGEGVEADRAKAASLFESVAATVPYARSTLARMYLDGDGVTADGAKAVELLTAGAQAGEPEAQYTLGLQYALGSAVPKDFAKARDLFEKASAQGQADAAAELGKMFFRGDGMTPDYAKAFQSMSQAADQGSAIGLANAGFMLATGTGVERDTVKAADYLLKALASSNEDATAYLITGKGDSFTRAMRKEVQKALKASGYYTGPVNGTFTIATIEALKAYQAAGSQ